MDDAGATLRPRAAGHASGDGFIGFSDDLRSPFRLVE